MTEMNRLLGITSGKYPEMNGSRPGLRFPQRNRIPLSFRTLFLLLPVLLASTALKAQLRITVTGFPVFNTSSLFVTEAGNDFPSSLSELQPNTFINVTHSTNNYNYIVYVSLAEQVGTTRLQVFRAGNGIRPGGGGGAGQITGGTNPVVLTTLSQPFFSGNRDRVNIPVQFALQNISVVNPAGTLVYSVIFTVTEQ